MNILSAVDAAPGLTPSASVPRERFHGLDGLRAIAALLVFLHHIVISNAALYFRQHDSPMLASALFGFGASGVEIFFCLSGVLLLRPYLRHGRKIEVLDYLKRRLLRLYPPFFVAWLISGFAVGLVWIYPTWWTRFSGLPGFDWYDWLLELPVGIFTDVAYNLAWWSLGLEVLFYLSVPLLVLVLVYFRRTGMAIGTLVLFCLFASVFTHAFVPYLGKAGALAVGWNFASYAFCFSGGVLLARYDVTGPVRTCFWLIGGVMVVASLFFPVINHHVGYGLIGVALVAMAADGTSRLGRLLSGSWFLWFGERSYSIFLTHYAAINMGCYLASLVFDEKGAAYIMLSRSLVFFLAILLMVLVFNGVESRFARNLTTADWKYPWRGRLVASLTSGRMSAGKG
ncbi:acyltransferase [Ideonella sp. B508-1]|uniref:acyltransferase family protein n=1 Tax=Ideonella sp. B508-1 TaxID=137716 RepID=UPI0003449513|nr:acyltransferase [Ideonella sp. B508-1]